MDQDDVVGLGREDGERVGDRLLALVAAFDDLNAAGKTVFGNLRLDALDFGLADGDVDGRDALDGGESAERMNEDGNAIEGEKLLGLRPGHPGTESGGGQNREYLHNWWSIQRSAHMRVLH